MKTMKKTLLPGLTAMMLLPAASFVSAAPDSAPAPYMPSAEIRRSQQDFASDRFGIFIHWGIYSMFAQGEWYLNYGPTQEEYSKAAAGFYPANFDAGKWADAIKASGAKYVCFTSRHHDGFSMWHTAQSPYNIVDATPFGRDILRELADSLASRDIALHLYYSHIDWGRPDYPRGRTGKTTGVDLSHPDWPSYYDFMNAQLKELLTGYGPIRCIWFDGKWDHDEDTTPFDWQLDDQYAMIHALQPGCLIGNNHHEDVIPGEDIQIFERDIPGQNTAGYSEQEISRLPLETCNTMNGMWGYKLLDQNYKDPRTLIHYLVRTAGMGANLLLNVGPQPDGSLPAAALDRLASMGAWMDANGETVYATAASPFEARPWGTSTRKDDMLYVHLLEPDSLADRRTLPLPALPAAPVEAREYRSGRPLPLHKEGKDYSVALPDSLDAIDYIISLKLK